MAVGGISICMHHHIENTCIETDVHTCQFKRINALTYYMCTGIHTIICMLLPYFYVWLLLLFYFFPSDVSIRTYIYTQTSSGRKRKHRGNKAIRPSPYFLLLFQPFLLLEKHCCPKSNLGRLSIHTSSLPVNNSFLE